MKPLILGMGPCRSYPSQPWHPQAVSTKNLCSLIMGNSGNWPELERSYEVLDLNKHWHWLEEIGDSVQANEAKETLKNLIESGALRGGRKTFLLGEQVSNFVLALLRRPGSALVEDAWRKLPKCIGHRLRTNDADARIAVAAGFYDFVVIPVWHPRILLDQKVRMPPGWQQQMMNAMRAAAGLRPIKFNGRPNSTVDYQKISPTDPLFPVS